MTATVTIPVTPTLSRADGTALALTDLSGITGYLRVKAAAGTPDLPFTAISTLAPASPAKFVIPDVTPGDYEFVATETDNQVPPLTSAQSAITAFNVPVPVVVLATPAAPTVGAVTVA